MLEFESNFLVSKIFFTIIWGRFSLEELTASKIEKSILNFFAVALNAFTSLGKHDPPYPGPACKNFDPIRLSIPIALATS